MTVEAAVALSAAWIARSPALLAFSGDSGIELLSAIVVLWRFHGHVGHQHAERRAARIAGLLLFALAAYVAVVSTGALLGYSHEAHALNGKLTPRARRLRKPVGRPGRCRSRRAPLRP